MKILQNLSIIDWVLGLVIILCCVWYPQFEELLQYTVIDHVVSFLPNASLQSDITIGIIMVVELFYIIKFNRDRINYTLIEAVLSLFILGSYVYSKYHQCLTFYHFSFCQYLDYCLALLVLPVVDSFYYIRHFINRKNNSKSCLSQGVFLEDCATKEDSFGRSIFARDLVEEIFLLENQQAAYTIGLNAKYGMGKTSFMYQMQELLDQHNTAYVCISPWSCTSNEQIVKDFFHSLTAVFGRKMGLGINKLLDIYKNLILDVQHAYKLQAFDKAVEGR